MGAILHPKPDGDARTMKLAIASTVLFLLLNVAGSDAIFKKKWKKAQEDPWEPTRVADPWPADTDLCSRSSRVSSRFSSRGWSTLCQSGSTSRGKRDGKSGFVELAISAQGMQPKVTWLE